MEYKYRGNTKTQAKKPKKYIAKLFLLAIFITLAIIAVRQFRFNNAATNGQQTTTIEYKSQQLNLPGYSNSAKNQPLKKNKDKHLHAFPNDFTYGSS